MRLRLVVLMAVTFIMGITTVVAETPAADAPIASAPTREPIPPPIRTRPHSVKCQATIQVWIEADSASLPAHVLLKPEAKKRVSLGLVRTSSYRGDTVMCAYANRNREITSSYAIHCLQPRKERGYRDSYLCQ